MGKEEGTSVPRTVRKQAAKQVFPHSQVTLKTGLKTAPSGSIPGVIPCANGRQSFILNIRYLCHSLLNKTMTVHSVPTYLYNINRQKSLMLLDMVKIKMP